MRKLALVTVAVLSACVIFTNIASAADPTRTDKINQRFNGKTYKGTVKYPWPATWKAQVTSPQGFRYHSWNMGGGCTARVWTDNVLFAEAASQRTAETLQVVATGSLTTPGFSDPKFESVVIGSGIISGPTVWWAFTHNAYDSFTAHVIANDWESSGRLDMQLGTRRYLVHRYWVHFLGTCTVAQRTTSRTAQALVASVRDAVVSIKTS